MNNISVFSLAYVWRYRICKSASVYSPQQILSDQNFPEYENIRVKKLSNLHFKGTSLQLPTHIFCLRKAEVESVTQFIDLLLHLASSPK